MKTLDYDDELNELERELQALIPVAPSADLQDRIELELQAQTEAPKRRQAGHGSRWLAVCGGLGLAACVTIILSRFPERTPPKADVATHQRAALPSEWQYYQAWVSSPEKLDALLDEHASELLQRNKKEDEPTLRKLLQ
ncbi:MAG: hypothetical protein WCT04_24410 [Planctomycetota bacterium]